jgi:hypothetical protein
VCKVEPEIISSTAMTLRRLLVVPLALPMLGGCAPPMPSSNDDSDSTTSTSGVATAGTDTDEPESTDTDEPDPPMFVPCADPSVAPRCAWEDADEFPQEDWVGAPLPPLPPPIDRSTGYSHCNHGLEPKFVLDGEVLVVAYRDEYCTDELGDEGEPLAPERYLVVGTDTLGSWQTMYFGGDNGLDSVDIEADGTVRVKTSERTLERNDGQWIMRTADTEAWILSDLASGPAHALVLSEQPMYGRLDGDQMNFEVRLECEGTEANTKLSRVDFELSPDGVPHVAQIGRTFGYDNALVWSYPSGGAWVLEQIECLGTDAGGGLLAHPPDLEFDANGAAYICTTIDLDNYEHVVFDNSAGTWTSDLVGGGEVHSYETCSIELDSAGRVHVLTDNEYRVREAGVWTTVLSFDDDLLGSLHVTGEGHVYILHQGLSLLTNASGEWVERQIGPDAPP